MCTRMDASPNAAGIGEARKIFEARKADLKAKWDAIQKANIGFDLKTTILKSSVFDNNMFHAVREKNAFKTSSWDKAVEEKFYSLKTDFDSTFK